jgi:hypothetical protein
MVEEINLAGGSGRWAEGAWMKETMVQHVLDRPLGRPRPRPSKGSVWEVEKSPWASACGNLDWAIWEIARRLSQGLPSVRLAIIRKKHDDFNAQATAGTASAAGARTPNNDVESSGAVNPSSDASRGKVGKVRELTVAPAMVLDRHIPRIISERKKEVYASAAVRAREAHEVLYYGRIFTDSVLANLAFTRNVSDAHGPFRTTNPTNPTNPTLPVRRPRLDRLWIISWARAS